MILLFIDHFHSKQVALNRACLCHYSELSMKIQVFLEQSINISNFKEFSLKALLPYKGEHKNYKGAGTRWVWFIQTSGKKRECSLFQMEQKWFSQGSGWVHYSGFTKHFCQSPLVNGSSQMVWSIQVCLPGGRRCWDELPASGQRKKSLFLKTRESRGPQWFGATPSSRAALTKIRTRPPLLLWETTGHL